MLSSEGFKVRRAFQYERLLGLCCNYGMLGHEAKDYLNPISTEVGEKQYGDWLRARSRKLDKSRGKKFGAQTGSRDETADQAREPTKTPRYHGESSSNDNPANLGTVMDKEKRQALTTKLDAEDNSISMKHTPHKYEMQMDVPEIMQLDSFGRKLISVPVTFMEEEGGIISWYQVMKP